MKPLNQDLKDCAAALSAITDSTVECGRLIAECCDRHPQFLSALAGACPGVSRTLLARLEKVGRGTLDPRVALGIEHGIFVERLSISDQKTIIDKGVEVAIGDDGSDTMVLQLEQMDRTTASRVIRGATIATLSQQRAEIFTQQDAHRKAQVSQQTEATRSRKILDSLPLVFDVSRKSVTVKRSIKLTLPQLYLIISELEGR